MTIDRKTLDLAREWADGVYNPDGWGLTTETYAAIEVLRNLPDEIVDAAKVRNLADSWRARDAYDDPRELWVIQKQIIQDLEALLPAPAPRVEVRMGAWAMHPEFGEVLIYSPNPDGGGKVGVARESRVTNGGTVTHRVYPFDLSPLPDDEPSTSAGPGGGGP